MAKKKNPDLFEQTLKQIRDAQQACLIAEYANEHMGWDGINNSKILSEFIKAKFESMKAKLESPSERHFHAVYPVPMCCGVQMKGANLSLHVLEYRCSRCFKQMEIHAKFIENTRQHPDQSTLDEMDQQE